MHYQLARRGVIPMPPPLAKNEWHRPFIAQKTLPTAAHPLVKRLFQEAARQRIGIRELCRKAGISPNAPPRWKHCSKARDKSRYEPRLSILEACFNVLGYRLDVVPVVEDE